MSRTEIEWYTRERGVNECSLDRLSVREYKYSNETEIESAK